MAPRTLPGQDVAIIRGGTRSAREGSEVAKMPAFRTTPAGTPHAAGRSIARAKPSARTALALVVVALAASLVVSLPQVAGAAPHRTKVVRYVMWTPTGRLVHGLHVAATVKGYCWTESLTIEGQYRCMAGNNIYDPCFDRPNAAATMVGCVANPWTTGVVEMQLTKKLPPLPMAERGLIRLAQLPWALRLSSGLGCVLGTGTNSMIDGHPMVYYCKKGVTSKPYAAKEPWTILYSRSDVKGPLTRKVVAIAWY